MSLWILSFSYPHTRHFYYKPKMLFDRDQVQLKVAWYSWQRPENVEGCLADTRNVEGCLAETGIAVWLITESGNQCRCLVETRELMWEPCKAKLAWQSP